MRRIRSGNTPRNHGTDQPHARRHHDRRPLRDHRGPEYVLAAGLYEGTDYPLSETDGFGPDKWGAAVENGDYILHIDYRKDRVRVKIAQATLGTPDAVRVAVRASGTRTDGTSHGLVDWVGKRRQFTPWLDRG